MIMKDGAAIGSIFWAQDGSPMLIVRADDGHEKSVKHVAATVAEALSARVIPYDDIDER
jgi:hypothetical protein